MNHFEDYDAQREREDALNYEAFGPSNEYEAHYQNCQRGYFAHPNPDQCGCRGTGYYLSQLDTWHECPYHYVAGQAHPEDPDPEEYEAEYAAPTEPAPPPTEPAPPPNFDVSPDDEDIPF